MFYVNSFLFICLLSTVNCLSIFEHGRRTNYLLKQFNNTVDSSSIEAKWIEQPLDHFNETDKRKWKMNYYQMLNFWKTGGPIYLFIGGEGGGFGKKCLQMFGTNYDLIKETNGAKISTQHRYYGDSKPFDDFTTENLKYLSSRQALADLAQLIENFKKRPEFAKSKVVAVGCSYPGNLAAWLRLLYPNLVDAAIASSGPVKAKTDFYEYLETVGDNFKKYGTPGCYEKIVWIFKEYDRKFETPEGIKQLKKEEQICSETDMTKLENKQLFFIHKTDPFETASQYGNLNHIKVVCESINTNSSIFVANDEETITWSEKKRCNDYEFDNNIKKIPRPWIYQTCTEFGYFQTTSSDNQPFTKNVRVNLYFKMCKAMFGKEFDERRVEEGIKKTNEMYGGLHPNVSKVVFLNGELDPWHRLSVLEDISSEAPAILIPLSSHCVDTLPDKDDDSVELKEARRRTRNLIKKWISGQNSD